MARKGYTEDGLPKRDREAGQRAIQEERAREAAREKELRHETFDVPQRTNPGHPDGYRSSR
jgi:hypothetical protein